MSDTAFYCVADERYFLGAVGLVNSLRLVGHDQPIHLLDCGLTKAQRDLLGAQVELVEAPREAPATLLKTIAPLRSPAAQMVLIDTDMIVTRSLEPLIADARKGRAVAFRNDTERWVGEWGELLDLGPLPRHPYLSYGIVALGGAEALEVLQTVADRESRIDFDRTYWREQRITDYPLLYADQDVLNAVLAAKLGPKRIIALDGRLAPLPPFDRLRLLDEETLRCAYDDAVEPFVVHHWLAKPWLEPTHHGIYSRLLRRLLLGDDVAVRVPEEMLPSRFRSGARAAIERRAINARERWRWHVAEPLARRRAR